MAHPHDINCRFCGAPLRKMIDGLSAWVHHPCPAKPPHSAEEGAAVAFGLMGMAEAIGRILSCVACPECGIAKGAWTTEPTWPYYSRCMDCFDRERSGRDRSADR